MEQKPVKKKDEDELQVLDLVKYITSFKLKGRKRLSPS